MKPEHETQTGAGLAAPMGSAKYAYALRLYGRLLPLPVFYASIQEAEDALFHQAYHHYGDLEIVRVTIEGLPFSPNDPSSPAAR